MLSFYNKIGTQNKLNEWIMNFCCVERKKNRKTCFNPRRDFAIAEPEGCPIVFTYVLFVLGNV